MNDGKDSGLIKVSRAFAIDRHTIIKFTHNIEHAAAIFQKAFCIPMNIERLVAAHSL